ncbi:MAG: arginine repressor [Elusimicrobia bacterium]|nr:arginine repressor [Elusimicrobiota bacterium]
MNKYANRDERKSARQVAILEVIASESVATQNALARALKRAGIHATQVSLSRDIAELGLVKAAGRYQSAPAMTGAADPELSLRTSLRSASAAGPHLVVLRTDTSAAQPVGLVIDHMTLPGIVGTIAGDDTVFVAVKNAAVSKTLLDYLHARIKKP